MKEPDSQILKSRYLKIAAECILCLILICVVGPMVFRLMPELVALTDWYTSIVIVVAGVFFGVPGVAACIFGYFLLMLGQDYPLAHALLFTFAKLPVGCAALIGRKELTSLERFGEFYQLACKCTLGCVISFFIQFYYYSAYYSVVREDMLYAVLNMLTSNICAVLCLAIPLCALIYRLSGAHDAGISAKERKLVDIMFVLLPLFMTVSVFLFVLCQPDFATSEEYWFKLFAFIAADEVTFSLACYLLWRFEKATLIAIVTTGSAAIAYGLIQHDPVEAVLTIALIMLYLIVLLVFKSRSAVPTWLKRSFSVLNCLIIFLAILSTALVDTIFVLPMADGTEPYAIVLGAPVYDGEASDVLQDRIASAERYLTGDPDMTIFLTGGVKAESAGVSEADLIGRRLEEAGVDPKQILYERDAKTTYENFKNIRQMFDERGFDRDARIALLTSEFHYPRATVYASRAGFHNLSYIRTESNYLTTLFWCTREALVFPSCLF